ncbi:MAG: helix-turn-helix domain-containing protein [Candidatus Omnitrophica bacterium]|nr:helix-turn-helix domain-containing protein [Candidatus Omnitrophota bacterium]
MNKPQLTSIEHNTENAAKREDSAPVLPRVLTIKEVSELVRIPVATIYVLAQQGKLRAAKFGRQWRFLEQDILNYFRQGGES